MVIDNLRIHVNSTTQYWEGQKPRCSWDHYDLGLGIINNNKDVYES